MTETAVEARLTQEQPTRPLALPLRLAVRQMRSGFDGFIVFIACVALGVMVISAIGGLASALVTGLESQGRQIIGGDIALSRMHARVTEAERASLGSIGVVSESSTMRSMARTVDGAEQLLAELKSVDGSYPLVGQMLLKGGKDLDAALANGVVVEPILLERLSLSVGDQVKIGSAEFTISGVIEKEPDGLLDRLTYGPRVLVSTEKLVDAGLAGPGTLIRWRYAIALKGPGADEDLEALEAARNKLKEKLSASGFTIVDRSNPSPQVSRTLERLRQFLTLIGLTALIIGGVGIANAVGNFVDRRRRTIATMKSLGASNRLVLSIFMAQILAITIVGIAIGLLGGALIPGLLKALYGDSLPIAPVVSVEAMDLMVAAGYGLLVALLFSLWPLGRAEQISPTVLFRDQVGEGSAFPRLPIVLATALIALLLAVIAVFSSDTPHIAAYFAGALGATLMVFYGLGFLVVWVARRLPRPKTPELAIALSSIAAPGGLTRTVVLSLGAGLSMLVAVALTDASLVRELTGKLPDNAPDYFMLDITRGDLEGFEKLIIKKAPGTQVQTAPMLRGRLVQLGGRNVEELKVPAEAEWALRGDRGITYSADVPDGSRIVAGEWWPEDYSGEPLVSFEKDLAKQLGVDIGDTVTVNVLGRDLTAKIANLRALDWESLSINFILVFSPNTLAGAPTNYLATVKLPRETSLAKEASVMKSLAKDFPAVTAIRVRDAVDSFSKVFERIMVAIRVAGSVTLVAGALVLAGALATAQRRRILDAVIFKALGATRFRILAAHAVEYLLLAALTAFFAIGLGGLAAWIALSQVIDVPFYLSWTAIFSALGVSIALVVTLGGLGTWQVLKARPVPYLKSE
ncbi:MAG: FtsX-like permease family protein [Filomicrobium sp.]